VERVVGAVLLVGIFLMAALAAPVNHHTMSERDYIEHGYEQAVVRLYIGVFDKLITNPPGDEEQAAANFTRGIKAARHAREIALKGITEKED